MGEKYDGIRCCWSPAADSLYPATLGGGGGGMNFFDGQRYSRFGQELVVLDDISNSFPNIFIDGEVWYWKCN